MVETFLVHSLLELRYREARVTKADAIIEDRARQFLKITGLRAAVAWRLSAGDGSTGGRA